MRKKIIFLDIDGTLTVPGESRPPESAMLAVREAQKAGHLVLLCTGRNMAMLKPVLDLGFDGVVASAGGYVALGNQVLYDCPMGEEDRKTAMDVLERNGVFRTIEALDATYGDQGLSDFISDNEGQEGNSEIERWRKALSENLGIKPMDQYDGRPIYKVVFMCLRDQQLAEAREYLEKDYDFVVQEIAAHGCLNGELINRKFDKGTGIRQVSAACGIPMEDTIGFGDSMNDLPMMDVVGKSVCMANGSRELKEKSDMICPAVTEDGLYKAFLELGLIESSK